MILDFITSLLKDLSSWFRPHLLQVSTAIIASILVIYGDRINRAVRVLVKGSHFIIKTLAFIALCAFGYGMATVFLAPILKSVYLSLDSVWLGPAVVASFIGVGLLAQFHNQQ